jgi:anti-anti-sigma factor
MSASTPTYDGRRPWEHELPDALELRLVPGSPPRLVVVGEVDLATCARFERGVADACRSSDRLVVDLTGLTFISSAGIGTLYRHSEKLSSVLVAETSLILRALGYAGFTGLVPVIPAG